MAKDSPLRRSTRSKKPSDKALANIAQAHVEKRRSPRLALLKKQKGVVDTPVRRRPLIPTRLSEFVVGDTGSPTPSSDDEDDDEDDDGDSDFSGAPSPSPEPEEHMHLTGDNFAYRAADPLDRRESYDSRLQEGNEEYEIDGFVVGDDESEEEGGWDDEITLCGEDEGGDEDGRSGRDTVMEDSEDEDDDSFSIPQTHSSIPHSPPPSPTLFVSSASTSSSSPLSISALFTPIPASTAPADVAEEINDAVSRFSRRCNRNSEPLRLDLPAQVWADEEVREAVERAVSMALGEYAEDDAGSVIVTVGLPGHWVMDSYL